MFEVICLKHVHVKHVGSDTSQAGSQAYDSGFPNKEITLHIILGTIMFVMMPPFISVENNVNDRTISVSLSSTILITDPLSNVHIYLYVSYLMNEVE